MNLHIPAGNRRMLKIKYIVYFYTNINNCDQQYAIYKVISAVI